MLSGTMAKAVVKASAPAAWNNRSSRGNAASAGSGRRCRRGRGPIRARAIAAMSDDDRAMTVARVAGQAAGPPGDRAKHTMPAHHACTPCLRTMPSRPAFEAGLRTRQCFRLTLSGLCERSEPERAHARDPGPVLQPRRFGRTVGATDRTRRRTKSTASDARLRTVPPVAPVTRTKRRRRSPKTARPYVETARSGRMRRSDPGQPHPLRQHGRADEAFHRHPRRGMGQRHPGGQTGGRCSPPPRVMHGGQEATLLTMLVPLLHHGCIIAGIPLHRERS